VPIFALAANVDNERTGGGGMGDTLTGFWRRQDGEPLIVSHAGDSLLCRLRRGEASILTRDQTPCQQAIGPLETSAFSCTGFAFGQ
jgi:serine/threonine protein phosphatase PrpC